MQIQDFKLFLEVAETGSFTKVAANRQTVQSHVSRQISNFEDACGGILFKRTGLRIPVMLTNQSSNVTN